MATDTILTTTIRIKNAHQNNLKHFDLELPVNELIVVTGVSGSGKSTLAFDTLYAEGQRRYVETFSAYARQFLDRMDKPAVDSIEGIPPAIAIDQTNPVRTSRSTVGTMTELNDYLKLLYARMAQLYCMSCGRQVEQDSAQTIVQALLRQFAPGQRLMITFAVDVPHNFSDEEVLQLLQQQGYTRIHARQAQRVEVIQDRLKLADDNTLSTNTLSTNTLSTTGRLTEALETALQHGHGRLQVYALDESKTVQQQRRYSSHHHCPDCDRDYDEPGPSLFSFNSALGACESCRGFGRIIGVDFSLVIPDENKSLQDGAVKPWQTKSFFECQQELLDFARQRHIPVDKPWKKLSKAQQHWVLEGEGHWDDGLWYGVRRFFEFLESKAYKMHIRVLLSRYRAYTPCQTCKGARLKPAALAWRLGSRSNADTVLEAGRRFMPNDITMPQEVFAKLPGLTIHDVMQLPLLQTEVFFQSLDAPPGLNAPPGLDEAGELLLREIRTRLRYLVDVGLGYLTLDRQSRTLSGGEVQRINLTTALGTSLVNTLFVLDEPSIGLHSRDMQRMVQVLHRLRDAGNTLLVVEHDPQVMLAADRIIDMGPGPGKLGGEICFQGRPKALLRQKNSLTGRYLSGKERVSRSRSAEDARVTEAGRANEADRVNAVLEIIGASEHNLKNIDVSIPLQRLVCLTGVSGSGKSTLMRDVLYAAICKAQGRAVETLGAHQAIKGIAQIDDVVLVDQNPIGKTTRSTPATYVGAFDAIRKLFVAEPLAKERGYTPGSFSFNSGNGRCPTCQGNGFEHVEMQFLSDVYLRCPDCDGRRFRSELLEVKILGGANNGAALRVPSVANVPSVAKVPSFAKALSIADVLELTVSEALQFFAGQSAVTNVLQPLVDVGLNYLQLGQPVPTLSGGEAQRLKLAGHLAKVSGGKKQQGTKKGTLFLFDEPTTGLHFADIAVLMKAFDQLLAAGHSLLIIEHNLDVIAAADWLIELGPEGGDAGGQVVCSGTPQQFVERADSLTDRCHFGVCHTGRALRDYQAAAEVCAAPSRPVVAEKVVAAKVVAEKVVAEKIVAAKKSNSAPVIDIRHAREHNLKNIDLCIPRDTFTVITGISGSGKSTLAFDLVFGEGQRRYLESLNAYARQFVQPASRPDVDAIYGIPPTVAIEQRSSRGGRKSTVATLTEIYHFLRLLFVKLGTQYCPDCDVPIQPQTPQAISAHLLKEYRGRRICLLAPLVVARKGIYKELAQWAHAKGYAWLRVDGELLSTAQWPQLDRYREHSIELPLAELAVSPDRERELSDALKQSLSLSNGKVMVQMPGGKKSARPDQLFSTTRACPCCGRGFDELDPRLFSYNSRLGWCEACFGTGLVVDDFSEQDSGEEADWLAPHDSHDERSCPACNGTRLNPVALAVRFKTRNIAELTSLSVGQAGHWLQTLKLTRPEQAIAQEIIKALQGKLRFLDKVGLDYLSLDRAAPTLSGGEAQRIRLAAQLGSNLQGVCYILDEPTIGLHSRDNQRLIATLRELQQQGNTVLVVEHDEETIREADHIIDIGPGAGCNGGEVVAVGSVKSLMAEPRSITGRSLAKPLMHPFARAEQRAESGDDPNAALRIRRASLHNLHNVDLAIPLQRLVCVSGVSGSGKSTLIRSVLFRNLAMALQNKRKKRLLWEGCEGLENWQSIDRVLEVDQTPIGKTPRSCPATYIGIWDTIRKLFADTVDARLRGYGAGRFSFNVAGGRCEECGGNGMRKIEMNFLPDVRVLCEQCKGQRFNQETLTVRYKGRHIGDVLAMNIDQAVDFFSALPTVRHTLQLLQEVGLGYLTLGQQSPTLSGGEAQRIKLVAELARANNSQRTQPHSLYVLDEPTVGLHMADVEKLIGVLHRLVDAGHSVVVIEHNLDVLAEADWLIDMGPEGGGQGGRVVVQGKVASCITKAAQRKSHTAWFLADFLQPR